MKVWFALHLEHGCGQTRVAANTSSLPEVVIYPEACLIIFAILTIANAMELLLPMLGIPRASYLRMALKTGGKGFS